MAVTYAKITYMKFESIPAGLVEHTAVKVEKYGLDLPVTLTELEEECADNKNCEQALSDMVTYAIRYACDVWAMKELVANKKQYDAAEWSELLAKADTDRTQLHNTFIDSIRILARALHQAERDNEWVRTLAPAGPLERAACGKFAIMLTYWISVNRQSEVT